MGDVEKIISPNTSTDINTFTLYEIVYKKEINNIIVISKFDNENKNETLEKLKICHNSRFILFITRKSMNGSNFENSENLENSKNLEILDKQIGENFEPISLHIIYGTEDKLIRVFTCLTLPNLKSIVKKYCDINENLDISLIQNNNNNKKINLDKIAFDKKNNLMLNLRQLRIPDKSIIFVVKNSVTTTEKENEITTSPDNVGIIDEEINCIVKIEDLEDFTLIKIKLNQTFKDLIEKINSELKLPTDQIRLRKEYSGNIIYLSDYLNKLSSDDMFLDGGVRLKVEYGEAYEKKEILLKIIMELNSGNSSDGLVTKEFIDDPEKITISELKKFICNEFNLKIEEYMFYKINAFGDPVKAIKNENQNLSKTGFKDCDSIYLKNISAEIYENFSIKIYGDSEQDFQATYYSPFKPIDCSNFKIELNLPKEASLNQLKNEIISNLKLALPINCLRVRSISKKMDPDRILRGSNSNDSASSSHSDNIPLKKLNIDNPVNLFIEVLENEEKIKDNQIQLYLWKRIVQDKTYRDKLSIIFEFSNNIASSDQLYELCRSITGFDKITIAKYSKFNYLWEIIPEMNQNNVINLRKSYNLRDGDWIAVRNDYDDIGGLDDFQTDEDKKILQTIRNLKLEENKAKANSVNKTKKNVEKTLRIPKFNN